MKAVMEQVEFWKDLALAIPRWVGGLLRKPEPPFEAGRLSLVSARESRP